MATLGLFDPELVPSAWFSPELEPLAWFDRTFVGAAAVVSFSDASVPVQVLVGVETAAFVLANDTSVPISAFVGVESATFVVVDDVGVPVNAFVGVESASFALCDDVSVPVNVFVGGESFEALFEDAGLPVDVAAPAETASVGPTPPPPGPTVSPVVLGGGTPLEDYEVGGYTLRELREVREALEEGSLIDEIAELPVREESAEDRRERESGEVRFSDFLKRIIEEPVKPKPEKKPTNWLPAVAIGAFLLGAWLATSGETEAFAAEELDDDLPDGPPDDGSDLGELGDLDDLDGLEGLDGLDELEGGDDLLFGEPLPMQGPEHATTELPELVESIEFRGQEYPMGEEIPLDSLSPEVADEELLRSIRQEAEEAAPELKTPRKRRATKARALTTEPQTVLAYRPGRGRA